MLAEQARLLGAEIAVIADAAQAGALTAALAGTGIQVAAGDAAVCAAAALPVDWTMAAITGAAERLRQRAVPSSASIHSSHSATTSPASARDSGSSAVPRSASPIPWLGDQRESLAPARRRGRWTRPT